MSKRIRIGICVVLCVAIFLEIAFQSFMVDVSFLKPLAECHRRMNDIYVNGGTSACPMSNDREAYVVFANDDSMSDDSSYVVVADRRLLHRRRVSLFWPSLRFGVVLLNDGTSKEWYGSEEDYQKTIEEAERVDSNRTQSQFFSRARRQ